MIACSQITLKNQFSHSDAGIFAGSVVHEVRVSNTIARELYSKYGFTDRELRRGYYSDNREDAVIMTVDDINSSLYQIRLKRLKKDYSEKWGASPYQIVR